MTSEFFGLVPVLTTPAGNTLTAFNGQEAGIKVASFYLDALLMKPGFEMLSHLSNLATYVGWDGQIVLNASSLTLGVDGLYTLRSHYDGSVSHYSPEDILALMVRLKPNGVILPEGMWQNNEALCQSLPEAIFPYISVAALHDVSEIKRPHGIYVSDENMALSSKTLLQRLNQYKDRPCYISGDLSLDVMIDLAKHNAKLIESDRPAKDACLGHVYSSEGDISIQNKVCSLQFSLIDESCDCPTCTQQFTRAYLHHLFEHTPLLCQRLLVQHNVHYCQQALGLERHAFQG